MKKYSFLIPMVALFLFTGGALQAAPPKSPSPQAKSRPKPARDQKLTLRLTGWISNFEEQKILVRSLEAFEKAHPGITICYEPFLWTRTDTYMAEVLTAIRRGDPPDLMYLGCQEAESAIQADFIRPLDDLIRQDSVDLSVFAPRLLSVYRRGGHTYGIPKDLNALCLFYNPKMFAEAGIPVPDASWTWDTLRDAAKRLSRPGRLGLCMRADDPANFFPFVLQNGGAFLDDARRKARVDEPAAVGALDFLAGLRRDRALGFPEDLGLRLPGLAFGQGRAAMMIEGGWATPFLRTAFPKLVYAAAPLPRGPAGHGTTLLTVAYVIPKEARHPKEAFKLLQYLTGRENQRRVLAQGLALPTHRSLHQDPLLQKDPAARAILQGISSARILDYGAAGIQMDNALRAAFKKVYSGASTPQEALESAAAEINRLLDVLNR